jgi:hypothetical protein
MTPKLYNVNTETKNEEISLKVFILDIQRYLRYIFSKALIIIFFGILGAVLGFFYAKYKVPVFVASTTFVLEEGNPSMGLGSLGGLASMVGVDVGGGGGLFQGDNILELYKSRKMVEASLLSNVNFEGSKMTLIDRYIDINGLKDKWKEEGSNLLNIRFNDQKSKDFIGTRKIDSLLGSVVSTINRDYLRVSKPDKKLSIVKVEVRSKDEFFAKAFNDKIVENVNDFYIQTKTKRSLENITILQQKTDSVRSVMNGDINKSVAISDATPNQNPTRQIQRVAPTQRFQFSAETNKAILGELVKNLELSKITLSKETPLIQVIDQPIFPLEKQSFGTIKGILIGGFLFGFLCIVSLIIRKVFLEIIS